MHRCGPDPPSPTRLSQFTVKVHRCGPNPPPPPPPACITAPPRPSKLPLPSLSPMERNAPSKWPAEASAGEQMARSGETRRGAHERVGGGPGEEPHERGRGGPLGQDQARSPLGRVQGVSLPEWAVWSPGLTQSGESDSLTRIHWSPRLTQAGEFGLASRQSSPGLTRASRRANGPQR